ncbi:MAG TPA: FAD-dependent oxidoreductase [Paracoccaceae bacterium]|nr:FAD-dependent oxidoreductase [Paracoccaceae bacterium]
MARIDTDLCVIGAGSGGLSVAAGAVQMGARVVLVEGGRMGGDCLNYGCVPSKALIAAAKQAQAMREAGRFGMKPVEPEIDYGAVQDHVRGVIAAIAPHDSVERFEGLGARVLRAYGRFVSPVEFEAGEARIRARWFVIATGSRPLVPPIPGLAGLPYLTNETLWELRERPEHLLVVGGGPIGLEMAQAHRRLGARVTVLEALRVLPRDDPEAAALVMARLRSEGVEIHEGAAVEAVSGGPGAVSVQAGGRRFVGSHLLLATGRAPNATELGLEVAGVEVGRSGVVVDAGLRTTNRRVFAIGDAAGGPQFTHVANYHAGIVIRNALFRLPARVSAAHLPWVTFTDPELAQAGLTEAEARATHGARLEILRFDFAGNDRAQAERATEGFAKAMVAGGRPVGATIVGAAAGEVIQTWALALSARLRIGALAGMVSPYPTLGEIAKRAAGQYYVPRLFGSPAVKRLVRLLVRL